MGATASTRRRKDVRQHESRSGEDRRRLFHDDSLPDEAGKDPPGEREPGYRHAKLFDDARAQTSREARFTTAPWSVS